MANIQYGYGQHQPYGQYQQQGYIRAQQGYAPAQPTQVIVSNSQPQQGQNQDGYGSPSSRTCAIGLGITIVIIGVLCAIFQIVASALYFQHPNTLSYLDGYVWSGLWIGAWFILSGAIGIVSGSVNKKGWIITFMILNIISCSFFVWVLLGLAATSLGMINECGSYSNYGYYSYSYRYYYQPCESPEKSGMAMNSLIIISSLTLLVICMIASIIGCGSICCPGSKGRVQQHGTIVSGAPGYGAHYANGGVQITHVSQYPAQQHFVPTVQPVEQLPSYSQAAFNQPPSSSVHHSQDTGIAPAPQYPEKTY